MKRQHDGTLLPPRDARNSHREPHIAEKRSIVICDSLEVGAKSLSDDHCAVVLVRRSLPVVITSWFDKYLKSPVDWPDMDGLHPMEATIDRVAFMDFGGVVRDGDGDPLEAAQSFGRNLPPRGSGREANVYAGLAEVVKVLPDEMARKVVVEDAQGALRALFRNTQATEFIVRLEFVRGDTCQKWHGDHNTLRSIVTYAGPGTLVADENGVDRSNDGSVLQVEDSAINSVGLGDYVVMKGSQWPGRKGYGGAAHRAPPIGPVGACSQHRLVLKVDIADSLHSSDPCANCGRH